MPQNRGKVSCQAFLFFLFCAGQAFHALKTTTELLVNIGKLHSNAVCVVVTEGDNMLFRR